MRLAIIKLSVLLPFAIDVRAEIVGCGKPGACVVRVVNVGGV